MLTSPTGQRSWVFSYVKVIRISPAAGSVIDITNLLCKNHCKNTKIRMDESVKFDYFPGEPFLNSPVSPMTSYLKFFGPPMIAPLTGPNQKQVMPFSTQQPKQSENTKMTRADDTCMYPDPHL